MKIYFFVILLTLKTTVLYITLLFHSSFTKSRKITQKGPTKISAQKQGAKKQWIRHVTDLINHFSLKKVKKGYNNFYKGKNFADEFWKLYTSCNHTNFTSYFDKNYKLRSQIPFLWKVITSLTEMLTLTEKLALLGERIKFLTSSCSNKYHITFSSFFWRHNFFNTA